MRILLVATGGTIASRPGPDGAVTVALTGAELLATVPGLDRLDADIDVVDLTQGPSWNLTPAQMAAVATTVSDALRSGRAGGVIVTQGTDTVEETAWVTELLAGRETERGPIVFTAAMRHAAAVSADGPANLGDAIIAATSPGGRGRGVLVCANGELHAARWVTKTDSAAVSTFRSPAGGPVGRVDAGRTTFHHGGPPRPPPVGAALAGPVPIVPSYGGADGGVIGWYLERGARGIVVEGTGAGNANEALVPGIEAALAAGVPVVVASRCLTGPVAPVYGGPGGGFELARRGVIPAGELGAVKARLALMAALGRDPALDAVRAWFAELTG